MSCASCRRWSATGGRNASLAEYLERNGIPGIQGIDTRALTKKLRVRGALNGFISTEDISDAEAVERAKEWPGLVGVDYVKEVTHAEAFAGIEKDEQSANFKLVRGTGLADAARSCAIRCRRRTSRSSPTISG